MHIPHPFSSLPILLPLFLPLTTALLPTHLIYEGPIGTWYENLAVRSSGSILITEITAPNLYLLNPLSPHPQPTLLHTFSSALWLLGITETKPDIFHLVAANGTLKTLSPTPGSNRIYTVAFPPNCNDVPEISLAATLPDAEFLNGMTTLNPSTVLVADSTKGVVWAVNIETGTSRIAISNPLMLPTPAFPLGINGIHLHGSTLYFTNTALALFARVPINPLDGTATGPIVNISSAPAGASYDDFAINKAGDKAFLVTATGNSLEEVGLGLEGGGQGKGEGVIVAGDLNSTELAEPTSCAFGRGRGEEGKLFVTTGGGLAVPVNGDEVVGGQVVGVEVGRG